MKTSVICLVLHLCPVLGAPQTSAGTFSAFSNFTPASQTFRAGSNTQLSQTVDSSQDTFFQSLDYGLDSFFSGDGLGLAGAGFPGLDANSGNFDVFAAATGE